MMVSGEERATANDADAKRSRVARNPFSSLHVSKRHAIDGAEGGAGGNG